MTQTNTDENININEKENENNLTEQKTTLLSNVLNLFDNLQKEIIEIDHVLLDDFYSKTKEFLEMYRNVICFYRKKYEEKNENVLNSLKIIYKEIYGTEYENKSFSDFSNIKKMHEFLCLQKEKYESIKLEIEENNERVTKEINSLKLYLNDVKYKENEEMLTKNLYDKNVEIQKELNFLREKLNEQECLRTFFYTKIEDAAKVLEEKIDFNFSEKIYDLERMNNSQINKININKKEFELIKLQVFNYKKLFDLNNVFTDEEEHILNNKEGKYSNRILIEIKKTFVRIEKICKEKYNKMYVKYTEEIILLKNSVYKKLQEIDLLDDTLKIEEFTFLNDFYEISTKPCESNKNDAINVIGDSSSIISCEIKSIKNEHEDIKEMDEAKNIIFLEKQKASLEKLQTQTNVLKELFVKRKNLLNAMIAFEKNASDPKRLKGSSLILFKEEHFMKTAYPTLKALEEEIYKIISSFDNKTFRELILKRFEDKKINESTEANKSNRF